MALETLCPISEISGRRIGEGLLYSKESGAGAIGPSLSSCLREGICGLRANDVDVDGGSRNEVIDGWRDGSRIGDPKNWVNGSPLLREGEVAACTGMKARNVGFGAAASIVGRCFAGVTIDCCRREFLGDLVLTGGRYSSSSSSEIRMGESLAPLPQVFGGISTLAHQQDVGWKERVYIYIPRKRGL